MVDESPPAIQDKPIHDLKAHVAAMAELAVTMVTDGARAFVQNDAALAASVIQRDAALDTRDVELESETIRTIAMVQPEGADLRTVGAVLKIANCVDRIGRLGYDLARMRADLPEPPDRSVFDLLASMEGKAREMVREAIDAFVQSDAPRAKRVFHMDDEVDAIHHDVQTRIFAQLHQGGPATDRLARALLAARHLERVGDNACKIAEKAVYAITGERRTEYFPKRPHRGDGPSPPSPA